MYFLKNFRIKNKQERTVTGWASVDMVDKDREIVDIDELEKEFLTLMDRGGVLIDQHSNIPIGKVLNFERRMKEVNGKELPGLFVTVKIFDKYKTDDEVWEKIKSGKYTGFSFGGASHEKEFEPGSQGEVSRLKDLEAHELSVVDEPANPEALFEDINMLAKAFTEKKVERRGDKWAVVHCHGPKAGQVISTHGSKEEAEVQHRAIQANKTEKDERPPKDWWDNTVSSLRGAPGVKDPEALAGWIYYHHMGNPPQKSHASSDVASSTDDYKNGDGAMSKEKAKKQDEEDKKPPFPPKPDEKKPEKKPDEEEKSSATKEEEPSGDQPDKEAKGETKKSVEERMDALEKMFEDFKKQISTSEEEGKTMQASPEGDKVKLPKDPTTQDTPMGEGKDEAESSQAASEVMEKVKELQKEVSVLKDANEAVKKSSTPRPFEGETSLFAEEDVSDPAKAVIKAGKEGKLPTWKVINKAVEKDADAQRQAAIGG